MEDEEEMEVLISDEWMARYVMKKLVQTTDGTAFIL